MTSVEHAFTNDDCLHAVAGVRKCMPINFALELIRFPPLLFKCD